MIPDNVQRVLNKLSRIDVEAAEYVLNKYTQGHILTDLFSDSTLVVACLFSWAQTPQGVCYWSDIGEKYKELPNITKKGNVL